MAHCRRMKDAKRDAHTAGPASHMAARASQSSKAVNAVVQARRKEQIRIRALAKLGAGTYLSPISRRLALHRKVSTNHCPSWQDNFSFTSAVTRCAHIFFYPHASNRDRKGPTAIAAPKSRLKKKNTKKSGHTRGSSQFRETSTTATETAFEK